MLYLENVGDREGLSDADLSDAIDDAPDRAPEFTIAAFEGKPDDAVIAIPILAGEVTNQIGPGRQVLATAICGLAEILDQEQLDRVSGEAAAAVVPVLTSPLGTGTMMPGALMITNSSRSRTEPTATLMKFGELVESTNKPQEDELHLEAVSRALEFLPEPHFQKLSQHLAAAFNRAMDGVGPGLGQCSTPIANKFWAEVVDSIFDKIEQLADNAAAEPATDPDTEQNDETVALFSSVVEALNQRTERAENLVIEAFTRGIVISSSIYSEALEYAESVSGDEFPDEDFSGLAALGIQEGPPADWATWARLLADTTLDSKVSSGAILRVLEQVDADDPEMSDTATELIEQLDTGTLPETDLPEIVSALESLLTDNPWTSTDEGPVRQFTEHVVQILTGHNPTISDLYRPARTADMVAVIQLAEPATALTDQVLVSLHTLSAEDLQQMLAQVDATYPIHPPTLHGMRLHTHLKTRVPDQGPFPVAALIALSDTRFKRQVVNDWIKLKPPIDDLVTLADSGFTFTANESLIRYAYRLTDPQRADLWTEFQRTGETEAVLRAVASAGVTSSVAQPIFTEALSPIHNNVRKDAVTKLKTLPLDNGTLIGEASETIFKLINTGRTGDVKLAAELAVIAQDIKGGHKGDVKAKFDQHRSQLTKAQQVALTAFKMLPPRKGLRGAIEKFVEGMMP